MPTVRSSGCCAYSRNPARELGLGTLAQSRQPSSLKTHELVPKADLVRQLPGNGTRSVDGPARRWRRVVIARCGREQRI